MKKADAVIAVSQDMKKMLQNDGVKQSKLHVIENFMTTTTYPALKKSSETLKFLFVGRLSPEKGCDVLIQALNKDMELTIVGDGVDRKRLEDLSRGLKVHFLGFRNDVANIMSEHDVVVMPSYREGQPLTLIEACCLGLPVVASDVGGIPELIKNGENGLLCESGNSSALRDNLVKMQNEFKKFSGEAQNQKEKFRTQL
jgi:glycosyltransferase involved in cell wall biosynthesis